MRPSPAWALLAAVAVASSATAQSTIDTSVDTTLVTVGDRVALTVTVRHPRGSLVTWPDSLQLAPFEVLDARLSAPRNERDEVVSSAVLSLAAFELGELEIPSIEVAVTSATGETEVLRTDRFRVEVTTVGTDEGGDIRDIRGPLALPIGPLWLLLAILLVLVPGLLAWLLYRRRLTDSEAPNAARGPPPRMAHELALEQFAALEGSGMLARGEIKAYHIEAAEILRTYVSRRFRVDALEMTSPELLRALDRAGVDGGFRDGLRAFLDQCDLVKFAKGRPDADRSRSLLDLGRRLVEATIPELPVPDVDVDPDEPEEGSLPELPHTSAETVVTPSGADARP